MGCNRNDAINMKLQVDTQPNIGLEINVCHSVVEIPDITLADEAGLSMKNRGALWNIHGAGFYDRHTLFDVRYKQLNDISDEISKRARLDVQVQSGDVPDMIDLEAAVRFLREDAKKFIGEYEDKGSFKLLVSVMCSRTIAICCGEHSYLMMPPG